MRRPTDRRALYAGLLGAIVGGLGQQVVNRLLGTAVIRDGILWGAVLAIVVASLPNLVSMGSLVTRRQSSWLNFAVGLALFLGISAIVLTSFYILFQLLGRLLT